MLAIWEPRLHNQGDRPQYKLTRFQARRNETDIGGLKRGASEVSKDGGPGACKFFMTTAFRSLENAPFLENVPLTEAKDLD